MGKHNREKDLFDIFKLDRTDPHINGFIKPWSAAFCSCYKAFEDSEEDCVCFYEFVNAFSHFYNMPESSQSKCTEMLDFLEKMWVSVYGSTLEKFCRLCEDVSNGGMEQCEELSILCMDMVEAIFVFDGKLPEAQRIFDAAHQAAMSGKVSSAKCVALLFILSARLWCISLGFSCVEEEIMLTEALKHHFLSTREGCATSTELYATILAYAVHDILCARREMGKPSPDTTELAKEAYRLLSPFDTQATKEAREKVYMASGITEEQSTNLLKETLVFMPSSKGKDFFS